MGAEHRKKKGEELDDRVRRLVDAGDVARALGEALTALGPELFGFLVAVHRDEDAADEVFAAASVRLWRSLGTFRWQCPLRTWLYILARNEGERFRRGERRHLLGRDRISELEDVLVAARSESRSRVRREEREGIARLRDELPEEDRALLILRVDRELAWDEIALAFADDPERCTDGARKREAARLRKRFQLVKERLAARARAEGLIS